MVLREFKLASSWSREKEKGLSEVDFIDDRLCGNIVHVFGLMLRMVQDLNKGILLMKKGTSEMTEGGIRNRTADAETEAKIDEIRCLVIGTEKNAQLCGVYE